MVALPDSLTPRVIQFCVMKTANTYFRRKREMCSYVRSSLSLRYAVTLPYNSSWKAVMDSALVASGRRISRRRKVDSTSDVSKLVTELPGYDPPVDTCITRVMSLYAVGYYCYPKVVSNRCDRKKRWCSWVVSRTRSTGWPIKVNQFQIFIKSNCKPFDEARFFSQIWV